MPITKQISIIICLFSFMLSHAQDDNTVDIIGTWTCIETRCQVESSDPRIKKFLEIFKASDFHFGDDNTFKLSRPSKDSIGQPEVFINSYWKFQQKNRIVIGYKDPSTLLEILVDVRDNVTYFSLMDNVFLLKMTKL